MKCVIVAISLLLSQAAHAGGFYVYLETPKGEMQDPVRVDSTKDFPLPGSDWRCFIAGSAEKTDYFVFVKCIAKFDENASFLVPVTVQRGKSAGHAQFQLINKNNARDYRVMVDVRI